MKPDFYTKAVLAAFLSAYAPLPAQTADPHGWSKAKWGMTVQQVTQAFANDAQKTHRVTPEEGSKVVPLVERNGVNVPDPRVQAVLQMNAFRLLEDRDFLFKVTFIFNRASPATLVRVLMSPDSAVPHGCASVAAEISNQLSDLYGRPLRTAGVDLDMPITTWRFPKTIISLLSIDKYDLCTVDLTYRMNMPGNL